jgi:hypothetical protein
MLAEKRKRRLDIEVFALAEDTPHGICDPQLGSRSQHKPAIIAGQLFARLFKLETIPGAADGAIDDRFSRNLFFARSHNQHPKISGLPHKSPALGLLKQGRRTWS